MNREKEILRKIKGRVSFRAPMRNHTTFHIGGPADILVVPKDVDDIKYGITYAKEEEIPVYSIGNGSKILVTDKGIRGMVIKIAKTLDSVEVSGERIVAGAGCPLSRLIKIATRNSLSGIEFATGIPGTLGGAVAMNAGTYLGAMSDIVKSVAVVDTLDNSLCILSKDDCCFGYRKSIFHERKMIITKVELEMKKEHEKKIKQKIEELVERRKRTQPLNERNAGCVFRNPPTISAGKLIETVGLKGFRIGDAEISRIHANFIVNLGKTWAEDVYALMRLAQNKVKAKYGIDLIPELRIIGEW